MNKVFVELFRLRIDKQVLGVSADLESQNIPGGKAEKRLLFMVYIP